jgi:hypothetical protein
MSGDVNQAVTQRCIRGNLGGVSHDLHDSHDLHNSHNLHSSHNLHKLTHK